MELLLRNNIILIFRHIVCIHSLHFVALIGYISFHKLGSKFGSLFQFPSIGFKISTLIILSHVLPSIILFHYLLSCSLWSISSSYSSFWLALHRLLSCTVIFYVFILWIFCCWVLLYRLINVLTIHSWRFIISSLWYNFSVYSLRILSISSN